MKIRLQLLASLLLVLASCSHVSAPSEPICVYYSDDSAFYCAPSNDPTKVFIILPIAANGYVCRAPENEQALEEYIKRLEEDGQSTFFNR